MIETARDAVFIDAITFPATDSYVLERRCPCPAGRKRRPDLATAVPRKIYNRFAGYLRPMRTRPSFFGAAMMSWLFIAQGRGAM